MSDVVNNQSEPPGVTWDLTIASHRYLVIEEGPATDCGTTRSRTTEYSRHGCRCDTCRIAWTDSRREWRRRRKEAQQ
jgi:hypothetical protein